VVQCRSEKGITPCQSIDKIGVCQSSQQGSSPKIRFGGTIWYVVGIEPIPITLEGENYMNVPIIQPGCGTLTRKRSNPSDQRGALLANWTMLILSAVCTRRSPNGSIRNFANTDNVLPGFPVRSVENCRPPRRFW